MIIQNDRFTLRGIDNDDFYWLFELHNDPLVLKNVTHPEKITIAQHADYLKRISLNKNELRMIFCVDGKRAGFTKFYSIDNINSNCVLGADLHNDFRGKKLSIEMWKLMLRYCFSPFGFCLHRVSLTTAEYNIPAIKTYKNLGFIEEGRLTQSLYRDEKYYDQLLMFKINNGNY